MLTKILPGGIIALGLVIKNLSSTNMIDKFQSIAEKAFHSLRTNLRLGPSNPVVYGEYVEGVVKKINTAFNSSKSPTTKAPKSSKTKSPKSKSPSGQTLFASLRARVTTQFDRIQEEYGPGIAMFGTLVATPLLKTQFSLVYGHFDTIRKRSIYPTKPLKVGLQEVLGADTTMFGSAVHTGAQRSTRVAVLAVKNRGRTACAIANYNRRDLGQFPSIEQHGGKANGKSLSSRR